MKNSIKSKLWLGNFLLLTIILLIIWGFQILFLKTYYIWERENTLLSEGRYIAEQLNKTSTTEIVVSEDTINNLNNTISYTNAHMMIISMEGKLVYSRDYDRKPPQAREKDNDAYKLPGFLNSVDIKERIQSGQEFSLTKELLPNEKRAFIISGVPIKTNEMTLGMIILVSPVAPIEEAGTLLAKQLSIITLISIIIGTLLALLFAKLFTEPILHISRIARRIAQGDYTARVTIDQEDEIGELGKIINELPEHLEKVENFRKEFIANTTHELKTPLSLIRAYAELVMDSEDELPVKREEYLQVIIDESERLNRMVEDILYLSQMEAGCIQLEPAAFSLNDTVNAVLKSLHYFIEEKEVVIIKNIAEQEMVVFADERKIRQVLLNIISNALNHVDKGGTIQISIDKELLLEISDDGDGIPEDDLPFIWDRFYKSDKSRKRDNAGTGLGLAIVKNILEAHRFTYGIESKEGVGTKVWMKFESVSKNMLNTVKNN